MVSLCITNHVDYTLRTSGVINLSALSTLLLGELLSIYKTFQQHPKQGFFAFWNSKTERLRYLVVEVIADGMILL
jgi:hypothetical protein